MRMKTNIAKVKIKPVHGTKGKIKWATINMEYTYNPPTETEDRISKIERLLKAVKPLLIFVEGMRVANGLNHLIISHDTPAVLKELISVNEDRLMELKEQDKTEKATKTKKKKK